MHWNKSLQRFGHYARINHVPGPVGGTFRQVYQECPLPSAGAARFAYATREIPVMPMQGAGYFTKGPPSPIGYGAQDAHAAFWLPQPLPPQIGTFGHQGLLPPVKPGS
jgi:hypothetical protein